MSRDVPANAPHAFRSVSDRHAGLLCMCTPAGQERFFGVGGDPVASPASTPPVLGETERAERGARVRALAAELRTELLPP